MEKAILRTLIYANIFEYPLKGYEIHKWLIRKKGTLTQVEKALEKLRVEGKAGGVKDYYFLPRKADLVLKRKRRQKQSEKYFQKAKIVGIILKTIPWIKLVGISGGLALNNTDKKDDIDFFIITRENRIWLSRILIIFILNILGVRRKFGMNPSKISGKICINTILEEGSLEQKFKDLFIAHEVLQMKVLWQRDGVYGKYLEDNSWAFNYLPNWVATDTSLRGLKGRSNLKIRLPREQSSLAMTTIENFAKWLQLKIMVKPQGMERIENGALYFYPNDCREKILTQFAKKVKKVSTT